MEPVIYNIGSVVIEIESPFGQDVTVTISSPEGGWSTTHLASLDEWAFEEMIYDGIAVNQKAILGKKELVWYPVTLINNKQPPVGGQE